MTARTGKSRLLLFVSGLAALVLLAACGALVLFVARAALPILYAGPVSRAPVVWRGLPTPVREHVQWTSYTSAASLRAVKRDGNLLWGATDGGLVVWDLQRGDSVKFTVEHGLPGNRITAVDIGPDGRVWVGAAGAGVAEYDGSTWTRYSAQDGLPGSEVRDLLVDQRGIVWVATDQGLGRYNGRSWTVARATLVDFSPPAVRDLVLGPGGLWAATDEGVWFFDGSRWEIFSVEDGLLTNEVLTVAVTPDGAVWAGSSIGLSRFDGGRWRRYTVRNGLKESPITVLAGAPDNAVWLAYLDLPGLFKFDGRAIQRTLTTADGLASNRVQSLLLDGSVLWIGTHDGLNRLDTATGTWTALEPPNDIPSNETTALVASQDAIWTAGEGGVSRFDGSRWQTYTRADGLVSDTVAALAAGADGRMHAAFSHPSLGVSSLDGEQWETHICTDTGSALKALYGGAQAPDGTLWFLGVEGVARYDAQAPALRWEIFDAGWPAEAEPRAIGITPDGVVWAGLKQGLYQLPAGARRWHQLSAAEILRLSISPGGRIWVATAGGTGIAHLVDGRLVQVPRPAVPDLHALLATDQDVWVSSSNGVARLTETGWQIYDTRDGLASRSVTALSLAEDETVWAAYKSSRLGFSYFDGEAWHLVHTNENKITGGLSNSAVNDVLVTPDGDVWVGTQNGLNRYDANTGEWILIARGLDVLDVVYALDAVWINTPERIARVDGFELNDSNVIVNQAHMMAADPAGRLWVAEANAQDYRFQVYNGNTWRIVSAPKNMWFVRDMAFEPNGRLWVFDDNLNLYVYDGERWQEKELGGIRHLRNIEIDADGTLWVSDVDRPYTRAYHIDEQARLSELELSAEVDAGFIDFARAPSGDLWAVGRREGAHVVVYQLGDEQWEDSVFPLPSFGGSNDTNLITDLEIAPNGAAWVGTTLGVARYFNDAWEFVQAAPSLNNVHSGTGMNLPPQDPVTRMSVTAGKDIWFGTSEGKVGRVSAAGLLVELNQRLWRWDYISVMLSFGDEVWLGDVDGQLARYAHGEWQRFERRLASVHVQSLVVAEEAYWLGTDEGVVSLDGRRCRLWRWPGPLNALDGLQDREGNIWWATANEGALRYAGDFEWPIVSLKGPSVRAMTAAWDGSLWFAHENTLTRYADGRREVMFIEGETFETPITALAIGPTSRPWVGTRQGVVFPQGLAWGALTTVDGLADDEVMRILAAPDGTLWFATKGGLSHYRP